MNAVIYARYSAGPRQTDQSIEGQIRDCTAYAESNGITIIGTYIDKAISGTDFIHRTEFNRLMSDCCRHRFDAVIVWKIDRFGRNREEIALNKVKLKKHNIKLLYAKEHIPEGPEGIILESLLEGMAEYYSAELSQKVKRGLRESMLKGHALGGNVMTGYKIVEKKYVIDPPSAAIVREIFERYASGESAGNIVRDLNSRHLVNGRGNKWRDNLIYTMLRNEKYIGIYKYNDLELDDIIPAIIDRDLWDRVQSKLDMNAKNKNRARASSPEEFILTGHLTCGFCGNGFCGESGTSRNGTIHYYYKCTAKKHRQRTGEKCRQRTFRKDELEEWIIDKTINSVLTSDMIDVISQRVIDIQKNDDKALYLESLRRQLSETEKSLSNLMRAIEMGIFTESTRDRLLELEASKEELRTQIASSELLLTEFTQDQIAFWLFSMIQGDIADVRFRERIVSSFISNVTIYEDSALIIYNFMEPSAQARCEREFEFEAIKKTAETIRLSPMEQTRLDFGRTLIYVSLRHFAVLLPLSA